MNKNIADVFLVQNFEEFSNGYLQVNKNSNYYYIEHLENKFITYCNLDLTTLTNINGLDVILCKNDYYDVTNGNLILSIENLYSIDDKDKMISNMDTHVKIVPLSKLLEIENSDNVYLNLEDINSIINSGSKPYLKQM